MSEPEANTQPVVSVCILTYQHVGFIAQAIEGALMQRTEFPVEILVGEDGSTDGTREVCLDYAQRFPDRVRVFVRDRKDVVFIDGLPRGGFNFRMTLREARGEFIALCEGDDFWTDPDKLQRQVDYLRHHSDCVGCFHDACLVDLDGRTIAESYFQTPQEKFNQRDVLDSLMSREPTCSLLFRRSAYVDPLPDWYLRRPNDLALDILLTNQGSLGFINHNMSAYRIHSGGIWSGTTEASRIVELIVRYKLLLSDPYFLEHHRELLLRKVGEFESSLFTRADGVSEVARLESVVSEQRAAIVATRDECQRLSSLVTQYSGEIAQLSSTAKTQTDHIAVLEKERDRLAALVKQYSGDIAHLSSTAKTQSDHIAVLEKERDRLAAEATAARNETARATAAGQQHIDSLKAQLDRTVAENEKTIAALRPQLAETVQRYEGYLAPLKQQLDQLAVTSKQQNQHIAVLEGERDRLAALVKQYSGDIAHLSSTAKTQSNHIAVLEKERDRLAARETSLTGETAHYLKVMDEQLGYIKILEAARSQTASTKS